MSAEEIREALLAVGEEPRTFIDLIIKATMMDDYDAICKLADALKSLRTFHARNTSTFKQLDKPSPVELEYKLSYEQLRTKRDAQRRKRATIMGRILADTRQPTTLRFESLLLLMRDRTPFFMDNPIYLNERSRAYKSVMAVIEGRFDLMVFELCLNAMHEEFLSPEDQQIARSMGAKMFGMCDPTDFDIDISVHRSKYETDSDEAVFERLFDLKYGEGTFTELFMACGPFMA